MVGYAKKLPEEKALVWKAGEGELKIRSLKELFDALVGVSQKSIDEEIRYNIVDGMLLRWLELNYPGQMELIARLRSMEEFTPQQVGEQLIRDLRVILKS